MSRAQRRTHLVGGKVKKGWYFFFAINIFLAQLVALVNYRNNQTLKVITTVTNLDANMQCKITVVCPTVYFSICFAHNLGSG